MTIIVLGTLLAFTLLYLFIFGINSDPFKKSFRDVDYITVKIVSIGDNGDEENKQLVLQNPEQVERLNQLFKQYGYKKTIDNKRSIFICYSRQRYRKYYILASWKFADRLLGIWG